ncbi:MAG: efflux RND transporter periplasmic adaptor subunit [Desulfovibrio sp.]|nr:efflux RND transporter periplasmic adaptor subunit [Desulfovibrio sp.]
MSLRLRWPGLILCVCVVILAFLAKGFWPNDVPHPDTVTAPVPVFPLETAGLVPFEEICEEPGFLVSDERVVLKTRISGFVGNVLVREGETVTKGQVLVVMDSRSVDAAIEQQRALFENSRIELHDARRDIQHYKPLVEQGAYPRDRLYKLNVRLKSAKAAFDQAEAALAASRAEKSYASIVSPLDGVVLVKHKNAGDMAVPGEPLLTLDARQKLLFRFFLPEHRLADIHPSSQVTLQFASRPGVNLPARIRSIIPAVDEASRRFEVNVAVDAQEGLVPGMYGTARVVLGVRKVLAVQVKALVERGGLSGVFVADETGRVAFRWLRLGRRQGGMAEVKAGLKVGEQVVLGAEGLRDGLIVAQKVDHGG